MFFSVVNKYYHFFFHKMKKGPKLKKKSMTFGQTISFPSCILLPDGIVSIKVYIEPELSKGVLQQKVAKNISAKNNFA